MNWLTNLILVVQILAAVAIVGLVLVQHGKGADMGASFGSGASGSLFGATGSANFLSRSTAVCAAVFFACTLALAYLYGSRPAAEGAGSVLDRPAESASAPKAADEAGSGALPSAVPSAVRTPASEAASGAAPVVPASAPASGATATQ